MSPVGLKRTKHSEAGVSRLRSMGETHHAVDVDRRRRSHQNCAVKVAVWAVMMVFCHGPPWVAVTQEGGGLPVESAKLHSVFEPTSAKTPTIVQSSYRVASVRKAKLLPPSVGPPGGVIAEVGSNTECNFALSTGNPPPSCVTANPGRSMAEHHHDSPNRYFTAQFDATPSAININSVVVSPMERRRLTPASLCWCASTQRETSMRATAALMRRPQPFLTPREFTYHFRVVVNVPAHPTRFCNSSGKSELTVGGNFASAPSRTRLQAGLGRGLRRSGIRHECSFSVSPS